MIKTGTYLLTAALSALALLFIVTNVAVPYGQYIGVALAILAAIIARNSGVNYETLVKRKTETRIIGYLFIISGVMVLGFYSSAWPTPKTASGFLIFIGALLVGVTLKSEKWQRL